MHGERFNSETPLLKSALWYFHLVPCTENQRSVAYLAIGVLAISSYAMVLCSGTYPSSAFFELDASSSRHTSRLCRMVFQPVPWLSTDDDSTLTKVLFIPTSRMDEGI